MRNLFRVVPVVLTVWLVGAAAFAQEAEFHFGDLVAAGERGARFQLGAEVLYTIPSGVQCWVTAVSGDWIGINVRRHGNVEAAWVRRSELTLIAAYTGPTPAQETSEPQPSEPSPEPPADLATDSPPAVVQAIAQEAEFHFGDLVAAGERGARFQLGAEVLLDIPPGTECLVTAVSGDWIGINVRYNKKMEAAWVRRSELTLVEAYTAPETSRPKPPADLATDGPLAVAAIERLAARLEFDEYGRIYRADFRGTEIVDADLDYLLKLPNLTILDLGNTLVTDVGLLRIQGLAALREIDLAGSGVTDAGLQHLRTLPGLRSVRVGGQQFTDQGMAAIGGIVELEAIAVSFTSITDAGLASLAPLTKLRELRLTSNSLTDAGVASLGGLTELELLDLSGTGFTDAGFVHLTAMVNLRELGLGSTGVTDAGLAGLAVFEKLESLNLSGNKFRRGAVSDAGLIHLTKLPALKHINLRYTAITDAGLPTLAQLSQLQTLRLRGASLSDQELSHLASLAELRVLDLSATEISDLGLVHLAGLVQLESLDLNSNLSLRGSGLAYLEEMVNLEVLDLSSTSVSDDALEHLARLTNLRYLGLRNTRVTGDGIVRLLQVLPEVEVQR